MKNELPYFFAWAAICCLCLLGCASDDAVSFNTGDSGIAGSYARFITVGDFLYIVDWTSISTFDLSAPAQPQLLEKQVIGERVESIFAHNGRLFIGSGSGLYIYSLQANGLPSLTASYSYDFPILPCDPVVANDEYAYVTLHDGDIGGPCGARNIVNELRIFDISDIEAPLLLATYPMSRPKGLGLDGTTLFVCDDWDGLKVLDVSNPEQVTTIDHIQGFQAFDVIPLDGLLLCVGPENVYQFDYTDLNHIQEISRIAIQP